MSVAIDIASAWVRVLLLAVVLAVPATASGADPPISFPRALHGSCVRLGGTRPPLNSRARLPARVLARFGLLRRAALPGDTLPSWANGSLMVDSLRIVFRRYVRRLGVIASGSPYFAIPASVRTRVSSRCLAARSPRERVRQRRIAARATRTLLLCLDDFDNGGGDYCFPAADALAGRAFMTADGPTPPGTQQADATDLPISVSALVPDGAVSLVAYYPGEAPVPVAVAGNFATFVHEIHVDPHAQRFPNFNPSTVIFKRADGSVLLTSHPPVDAPAFGGE